MYLNNELSALTQKRCKRTVQAGVGVLLLGLFLSSVYNAILLTVMATAAMYLMWSIVIFDYDNERKIRRNR